VEHTTNSSTGEADVRGSRLQASLGFTMRTCTKKENIKENKSYRKGF
jgi:hypothetical protein